MKSGLHAGATPTRRITVDRPRSVNFLGENLRARAAAKAKQASG
jgi:hypothetical protein